MSAFVPISDAALAAVGRDPAARLAVLDLYETANRTGYAPRPWDERGLAAQWGMGRKDVVDLLERLEAAGCIELLRSEPGRRQKSMLLVIDPTPKRRNQKTPEREPELEPEQSAMKADNGFSGTISRTRHGARPEPARASNVRALRTEQNRTDPPLPPLGGSAPGEGFPEEGGPAPAPAPAPTPAPPAAASPPSAGLPASACPPEPGLVERMLALQGQAAVHLPSRRDRQELERAVGSGSTEVELLELWQGAPAAGVEIVRWSVLLCPEMAALRQRIAEEARARQRSCRMYRAQPEPDRPIPPPPSRRPSS